MANQKTSDYAALPGGVPNDAWLLDIANPTVVNYKGTCLEFKDYVNAGKTGGKTITGGTLTTETLLFRNNAVDLLGFDILGNGLLRSNVSGYEALVSNDNDFITKKWYDDHPLTNIWEKSGTNIKLQTLTDTVVLGDVGISTGTSNVFEISKNSDAISSLWTSSNVATEKATFITTRTRGTLPLPAAVQNADEIAEWQAKAYEGSNYLIGGSIKFEIDGVVGTNQIPTKFTLALQDGVTVTPTDVLTIDHNGNQTIAGDVQVGGSTDGIIDVKDSSDVSQAKLNPVGDGYHMQDFGIGTKTPATPLEVVGIIKGDNLTIDNLNTANGIVQTDGSGVFSSSVTLPNGTLATTQSAGDNSTKLATTAYVYNAATWSEAIGTLDTVNPTVNVRVKGVFLPDKFTVESVSSVQSIVAATGIATINDINIVVESSTAGDTTVTANPAIVNGSIGQVLTIWGSDNTKTVTFTDGNGLQLDNGQSITLGLNDNITFKYINGDWIETSRCIVS